MMNILHIAQNADLNVCKPQQIIQQIEPASPQSNQSNIDPITGRSFLVSSNDPTSQSTFPDPRQHKTAGRTQTG
jgi:hypothetical protein